MGEAPGDTEDKQGMQFVGDSGQILRSALPRGYEKITRWNNTIRCHPPGNREPSKLELQCCRKSIEDDIARTKPKLILLMGAVPLEWMIQESKVLAWRGRIMPVRVGTHECYAMSCLHPSFILRSRNSKKGREMQSVFEKDLTRAYALLEAGEFDEPPWIPKPEEYYEGIELLLTPDLKKLRAWLEEAATWEELTIDLETNALRPYNKDSRILSLAVSNFDKTFAIPYRHSRTIWSKADLLSVRKLLKDFLFSSHRKWAHNLNFELEWLVREFGEALAYETSWGDT
ncbi:MAG: uracil-DNA glycosylase family protein, partial [candidate division WOR-3 bacterium]